MKFLAILAFRIFIATLVLQTYFHPDEWYQSTEVAYKYVHSATKTVGEGVGVVVDVSTREGSRRDGSDDVKLSWEWDHKIRSFAFPSPFAAMYATGKWLGVDSANFYWYSPKVMIAIIAAFGDYQLYKLAEDLFGSDVATDALTLSVLCWWNSFHLRTLSNIVEGVLLTWCLRPKISHRTFFLLVAVGCCLRITFVIPVLFPALQVLARSFRNATTSSGSSGGGGGVPQLLLELFLMVMLGLIFVVGTDYLYYGELVVTPWRFLHFNLIQGLSKHFGTHPFHWYVSNGLPTILGGHLLLIPALLGVQPPLFLLRNFLGSGNMVAVEEMGSTYRWFIPLSLPRRYTTGVVTLTIVVALTLLVYSLIPHKEFRFIDPIVPALMILLVLPFTYSIQWRRGQIKQRVFLLLALISCLVFLVFGVLHQRGTLAAVDYLRNSLPEGSKMSVHCLMGCHALPGYSALHDRVAPGGLVQNDCRLQVTEDGEGVVTTEHHFFRADPIAFTNFVYLRKTPSENVELSSMLHQLQHSSEGFQGFRSLPDRFILYSREAAILQGTLLQPPGSYPHYELEQRFFHTFFLPEDSMDHYVEIWKKKK